MLGEPVPFVDHPGLPLTEAVAVVSGVDALVRRGQPRADGAGRATSTARCSTSTARAGSSAASRSPSTSLGALLAFVLRGAALRALELGPRERAALGSQRPACRDVDPAAARRAARRALPRLRVRDRACGRAPLGALVRRARRRPSASRRWSSSTRSRCCPRSSSPRSGGRRRTSALPAALRAGGALARDAPRRRRVARRALARARGAPQLGPLPVARPTGAQLRVTLLVLALGVAVGRRRRRWRAPRELVRVASRFHALLVVAFPAGCCSRSRSTSQDGMRALVRSSRT